MVSWSGKGQMSLSIFSFCIHRLNTMHSFPFFLRTYSIGTAGLAVAETHQPALVYWLIFSASSSLSASVLWVAQATWILWKSRPECQKCRGFLELASARVLHLPSVMSRVFQTEVMNQVSRLCQNRGCIPEQFQVWVRRQEKQRFGVCIVWRCTECTR